MDTSRARLLYAKANDDGDGVDEDADDYDDDDARLPCSYGFIVCDAMRTRGLQSVCRIE